MRIRDHVHSTVFLLRRRLLGPGRFDAIDIRFRSVRFAWRPARASGAGPAHRAAAVGPFFPPSSPARHTDRPEAWPYDTAFPTALPPVSLFPGQSLTDMPSTGAQLAKRARSDNHVLGSMQPVVASPKAGSTDHLGTLIDVFA